MVFQYYRLLEYVIGFHSTFLQVFVVPFLKVYSLSDTIFERFLQKIEKTYKWSSELKSLKSFILNSKSLSITALDKADIGYQSGPHCNTLHIIDRDR